MLNAVLALNELDTAVFDSPSLGAAPRIYDDFVTVPDAHLLFNGEFKRVGTSDLKIVGEDGQSFFIPDYFAAEKRAHLMSPEGATLSPRVVEALAGPLAPGQLAQAGAQPGTAQPVIGRVDAVTGSATVVRNGVTVALNIGDTVRKGDVVQTSGGSAVAIVFADGSTFSLNANARMVLDNFVYNAGGAGNAALVNLVQGTFSFVAGQVAKTGDMRVETPVATMGIRGTAVLVEISASDGQTRISVMVEPDGTTGSLNLYNKTTGTLIGTVNNSQIGWVLTPAGPLQVIAQQVNKTPAELQQELGIVQQIFTIFNNNQQNPFVPPQQDNQERRGDKPNDTNPQTAQGTGGSGETINLNVPVTLPGNTTPTVVNVTITQVLNNLGLPTLDLPNLPTLPDGLPSLPLPTIPELNIINGEGVITGTPGADQIFGSESDDTISALAGDDLVFAGGGNDTVTAGEGEGNDFYDGGSHSHGDVIKYQSAAQPNEPGVTFNLNSGVWDLGNEGVVKSSTAFSATTGFDVFIRFEKIIGSPGNDVFVLHDAGDWEIDAGAGIDTVRFANGLDILDEEEDGPDIINFEIVDLATDTTQNIVRFDFDDFDAFGNAIPLHILGGTNDVITLTNESNLNATWTLAEGGDHVSAHAGFPDAPAGTFFDIYEVTVGEATHLVYVQEGVQITLPGGDNNAPVIVTADDDGSVSAGAPISSVGAGYLTADHDLINGLGGDAGFGEGELAPNDDGSTQAINITSVFGEQGLNFFGTNYTSFYINNNGNITFLNPTSQFTPGPIAGGSNNPIIAPFWADVDTRGGDPANGGTNLVYYDLDAENGVVTITWDDVGYFSTHTDKLNAFQLQLIDRGDGNFDIVFRYEDINWTAGDASGGSGGLGGTPARAGYTAGDNNPAHYFELSSSGNQTGMLALESTVGNTGIAGVQVFEVRAGDVGSPTSSGNIEFSDANATDTHTVSSSFNAGASDPGPALGILTATLARDTATGVNGLVTWNYVANSEAVGNLPPGTTRTEVYDVVIDDGHGGTITQQVTITINGPENHAPVLDELANPALVAVNEDAGAPVGAVGTLVSDLVDLDSTEGGLNNVTDADAGAVTGIAIYGVNQTNGTLYYSTNNGATWSQVGTVSDNAALLLAADANTRLYFQPSPDFNGTINDVLTFRAWDQTEGTNGGTLNIGAGGMNTDSVSSAPDTASIAINPVNDAPTTTNVTASGNEDASAIEITLAAEDVDGSVTGFKLTSLPLNGDLSLSPDFSTVLDGDDLQRTIAAVDGSRTLYFRPNGNWSGETTFGFVAIDNDEAESDVATATIDVAPVADAPVLTAAFGIENLDAPMRVGPSSGNQTNPVLFNSGGGNIGVVYGDYSGAADDNNVVDSDGGRRISFFDAAGDPTGPDLFVNQTLSGDQANMHAVAGPNERISAPDGSAALLWNVDGGMAGRIIAPNGQPSGDEFFLPGGSSYTFGTALTNGGFAFSYRSGSGYSITAVDQTGVQIGNTYNLNPGSVLDLAPLSDGGYLAFYESSGLVGLRFDASASLVEGPFQVSTLTTAVGGEASRADVATETLSDGDIFLAWTQYNPATSSTDIFGRIFDSEGAPLCDDFLITEGQNGSQSSPELTATSDGRIAVSWRANGAAYMRFVSADGTVDDGITQISTTSLAPYTLDGVATPDGGVFYAWRGLDSSGEGVHARHIGSDGIPTIGDTLVSPDAPGQQYFHTVVATSDGSVFVSWLDEAAGSAVVRQIDYGYVAEGSAISFQLSAALTDTDGSEVLQRITLSDLPEGFSLAVGARQQDGTWLIDRTQGQAAIDLLADLADGGTLTVTPDENYHGSFTLQVTATSRETANGSEATSEVIDIPITVAAVNEPPQISVDNAGTMEGQDQSSTTLFGLEILDADAPANEIFHITAVAGEGTLSMVGGDDEPAQRMDFDATRDQINTALDQGIVYHDPAEEPGLTDAVVLTVTDAHGASDTISFVFSVFGDQGVNLTGTTGKHVLFTTGFNDTLTGGDAEDVFVFESGTQHDTITDFTKGEDRIALYDIYDDYDDMVASGGFTQLGGNQIYLGPGQSITLQNFNAALNTLNPSDFIFHT